MNFKRESLADQFPSLALDRPEEKELKTEEEMRRHTIDTFLEGKPIERALHLLTTGEEVQRLSVIQTLPQLLKEDETHCMQRVVPVLQKILQSSSAEFLITAASVYLTILENKLVSPRTFQQTFLQGMIICLDYRDPMVRHTWFKALLSAIEFLPDSVIKCDILPLAVSKGRIAQPKHSRLMSCKLLGKIAGKLEPNILQKDVMPIVHSLSQDISYEVRGSICSQFHLFAEVLDTESVETTLLSILVELSGDEESSARCEGFVAIISIIPYLKTDKLKYTVVPIVKKMCENSLKIEDSVLVTISEHFGRLCLGLENQLSSQEKTWMLKHYQKMAKLGLQPSPDYNSQRVSDMMQNRNTDSQIACRLNCASNFSTIVKFWLHMGNVDEFVKQLYPTFQDLASDSYFMIRATIACDFNEIVQLLGKTSRVLKPELIKLLKDTADEVIQGLVPLLGSTLVNMSKFMSSDSLDTSAIDIGMAVIKCEGRISLTNNWRLHEKILGQLEWLPKCVPSDFINSHSANVFDRILTARPVPCRLAAARTLLIFLRNCLKQVHRNSIRARINTELRLSSSWHKRMLFVKLCAMAIDIFSRNYFKENFFTHLIELADDQVPNIRWKLLTVLPSLKNMLSLPKDQRLLNALEGCVRKIRMHEKDRDVKLQLRITVQMLDDIEVRSDDAPLSKEDLEDQRKVDEESKLMTGGVQASASRRHGTTESANGRSAGPPITPTTNERKISTGGRPLQDSRPTTTPARSTNERRMNSAGSSPSSSRQNPSSLLFRR